MHRWIWRLRYPAPQATHHEYPIAAIPHDTPRGPFGPTVLPGNYSVRLTVDGKPFTAPLVIKMDPRVKTSAAGLHKKFQAEMRLASAMTDTTRALTEGNSIRTQIQKLHAESSQTRDAVEQFEKKLNALVGTSNAGAPSGPELTLTRVNSQAATLYGAVSQVDAEPTTAQTEALASVEREGADALKRWAELKKSELPAVNKLLRGSQAPELKVDDGIDLPEVDVDEE